MRAFCSRYTFHFNALRNYLRKLERRPKWQHIRFTYDIISFLWSVQPLRVTPAYTGEKHNYPVFSCGTTRHPCVYGGKALRLFSPHPQQRITPAHAGKRLMRDAATGVVEDHPRACGEKNSPYRPRSPAPGSPPRMRGKAHQRPDLAEGVGITPAYAGKSPARSLPPALPRDHPRVCGEKIEAHIQQTSNQGSPPRMRGKASQLEFSVKAHRITPAYAGKSHQSKKPRLHSQDHPRVCGEKEPWQKAGAMFAGSPPRMRGKEIEFNSLESRNRITPAYAGKSLLIALFYRRREGSPPRMRGKVVMWVLRKLPFGITPAHAGKSLLPTVHGLLSRDHPRACGEKGRQGPLG